MSEVKLALPPLSCNSMEQLNPNKNSTKSSEPIILTIVLIVFLLISLVQAFRLVKIGPWQDQIMFVDPAANLYFGNGFTSSAWFAQTKYEFWSGYPPLYSFLLYLWMRIVGFGIYTGHTLNCLLVATCIVILWRSVIRLNLITSAKIRLIFLTLVLIELIYINNAQRGRPDVLMACLAATSLLIYSIPQKGLRHKLLLLISIFIPLTALAAVAYTVLICGLLIIFLRKPFLRECIFIVSGLIIGFLLLYILYTSNGVWLDFINSILKNPTLAFDQRGKIAGIFGNRILDFLVSLCFSLSIFEVLKRRFNQFSPSVLSFVSISLIPLGMLLIAVSRPYYSWVVALPLALWQFNRFSPLSFGLVAIFWIPVGMRLMAAFPWYYSWMLVVPLAIVTFSSLDKLLKPYLDRQLKPSVLGSILIILLIVAPYSGYVDLLLNWKSSSYLPVESFIQTALKTVDKDREWVLCDPILYFAAKKENRVVLYQYYLDAILPEDKEKVSTIIVRPQFLSISQDTLGGRWYKDGKTLFVSNLEEKVKLEIYRRG